MAKRSCSRWHSADIKSADRELRRKTAAAITETLRAKRMELTFIFNVLAADKATNDRLRQYPELGVVTQPGQQSTRCSGGGVDRNRHAQL
ncbi:MAG UNVERIFIED_CONTAM: hypothetical protein LVT10_09495 [Anaerolineae bacterium]